MIPSVKRLFVRSIGAADVARHYDQLTADYMAVGGDIIQALRPTDSNQLLEYLTSSIGLRDGMHVLDAGCGIGGPAIYFAERLRILVDGVTISSQQAAIACEKVAERRLSDRVRIRVGDYCKLEQLYRGQLFDVVMFIESLGHSANPGMAIRSAFNVLRPGGLIYIKDFYPRASSSLLEQLDIDEVIENINENYCYNTLDLVDVISALRRTGFEINSIKKPDIAGDFSYTESFEKRVKLNTFTKTLQAVEWLEILCTKR
jgi:cyclopropane fatty-acyl-phospholipid synthase-like methyltransferase